MFYRFFHLQRNMHNFICWFYEIIKLFNFLKIASVKIYNKQLLILIWSRIFTSMVIRWIQVGDLKQYIPYCYKMTKKQRMTLITKRIMCYLKTENGTYIWSRMIHFSSDSGRSESILSPHLRSTQMWKGAER